MLQERAFTDCGYRFYCSFFNEKDEIPLERQKQESQCVLAFPEGIISCFSDYEKSTDKEQFLAYYMFEFSNALLKLKRKDWFLVYSLSLLYFTGFREAVLTRSESDCILEIPEKKTKQAHNYRQIWDSICFHDTFSMLQSLACNEFIITGQNGIKSMSIELEENRVRLYERTKN